jgi:predicted secreted protein
MRDGFLFLLIVSFLEELFFMKKRPLCRKTQERASKEYEAMKTFLSSLLLLIMMTVSLSACANSSEKTITITEQDAEKTIELEIGDTLIVFLDGNMTTGFSWIPAPQTPVVLEQVGDIAVTPESNAVGAPGKLVLTFKAIATGQTTLHLDYKRAWEEGISPEKTFEVTVVVK